MEKEYQGERNHIERKVWNYKSNLEKEHILFVLMYKYTDRVLQVGEFI